MAVVGIRREDKNAWERRTPLIPEDVEGLVSAHGLRIHVQRSACRCFPDAEYARAGATLTEDLREADVVLAVKEIPVGLFERGKTYVFFSHTIKGQPYNMPMLRRLLDLECSVVDYELITDDRGVRSIAFGRHAGLAGAIDTLWALGQRLARQGHVTPLVRVRSALAYGSLEKARDALEETAEEIAREGFASEISPIVIGVTGSGGKVFRGATEVLGFLPHRLVEPEALADEVSAHRGRAKEIWIVGFGPEHLVEPARPGLEYSFKHYLANPDEYRARFGPHLAHLTAVIHGIHWREGYPRFILREDLARLWNGSSPPKLQLITDITCDLGGSNESLVRIADSGNPTYVFDPATGEARDGWEGDGPLVLAVDILPAEIPVDASRHFSERLTPLVPALARGAPDPDDESLPGALRRGTLVHRGRLVPPWDERLAVPLRLHGDPGVPA